MSVRVVGETRLGKRVVFGMVGALVVALVAGFLAGGLAGEVSPVHAASCIHGVNYWCGAFMPKEWKIFTLSRMAPT